VDWLAYCIGPTVVVTGPGSTAPSIVVAQGSEAYVAVPVAQGLHCEPRLNHRQQPLALTETSAIVVTIRSLFMAHLSYS
jgi:hypothetical protein